MFFIESSKRSSQINILTQHGRQTIYRHPCLIRTIEGVDSSFVFKDEKNSFYYRYKYYLRNCYLFYPKYVNYGKRR